MIQTPLSLVERGFFFRFDNPQTEKRITMQVTHASTEVQSASIGLNHRKAEAVQVTTDAEFMMNIAHGIYSNKVLALVRELLCNARDGMMLAGKINDPIKVTLNETQFVVRDHGTGIENDRFRKNYLTFGGSTKKNQANQTGGFGVGSKVPWAVCDTFSARNFHNGIMTAYSIMKADPNMDGMPTCTPVVSVPSTEPSGVEVTVPINARLFHEIETYIQAFVWELGFNIELNGSPLIRPFEHDQYLEELNKFGFAELPSNAIRSVNEHSDVYIRLGDVLYPVTVHDDYQEAWEIVRRIKGRTPLILLAEPGSITPSMSRENISYTARGVEEIKKLLVKVLTHTAKYVDSYAEQALKNLPKALKKSPDFMRQHWVSNFSISDVFSDAYPSSLDGKRDPNISLTTHRMLCNNMMAWLRGSMPHMVTAKYNTASVFREEAGKVANDTYKELILEAPYLAKEHTIRAFDYKTTTIELFEHHDKEVRFAQKMEKMFNHLTDVCVLTSNNFRYNWEDREKKKSTSLVNRELTINSEEELANLRTSHNHSLRHTNLTVSQQIYLSKAVVLVKSWATFAERYDDWAARQSSEMQLLTDKTILENDRGILRGARIYKMSQHMKNTDLDALRNELQQAGYFIIDLTQPTASELEEREEAARLRRLEREKPLTRLHDYLEENVFYSGYGYGDRHEATRKMLRSVAENPKYAANRRKLFIVLGRKDSVPWTLRDGDTLRYLFKAVGNDIVIVTNKLDIARAIREGYSPIDDALVGMVRSFFTRPGMHEKLYYRGTNMQRLSVFNPLFARLFFNRDIPQMTNKEDAELRTLTRLCEITTKSAEFFGKKSTFYAPRFNAPDQHYRSKLADFSKKHFCRIEEVEDIVFRGLKSKRFSVAFKLYKQALGEHS